MVRPPDTVFGVLRHARRVWAVGAIHAQSDRLSTLHLTLASRFRRGDRLVYLGNYFGHGAAVTETLDELLLFRRALVAEFTLFAGDIVYLRGRQEEMWQKLLQLQTAQDPSSVFEWMLAQGLENTLRAYGGVVESARARCREGPLALAQWSQRIRQNVRSHPGHETLLTAIRRAAYTEPRHMLFVHAGLDTKSALTAQRDSFWWGGDDFDAITTPYEGFRRIVRGYDPAHGGGAIGTVTATIDSGCGFGGHLSAVCFDPDGEVVDHIDA